ncbi:unnamed protein product [Alternaria alternata]
MSGAEAILVLGVISSIIAIIDGTKQVYDAATNPQGLPAAFHEIANRLPIIRTILSSAEKHIKNKDVDESWCKGVRDIINACEEKAKVLDMLFHKAIPGEGVSRLRRYYTAVKSYGKGNEVETLMKKMLEDVQLLACEHGMKTVTKAQKDEIAQAIEEVSEVTPSVPDDDANQSGLVATNTGKGTQNNALGEYIAQGQARQFNSGGGPMNFANIDPSKRSAEDEEQRACLKALFLTDPAVDRDRLLDVKGERAAGTCKWILTDQLYKMWFYSDSCLLWLSGGPGAGKTMLSIFLVEELRTRLPKNTILLQYFCKSEDKKRNTAVTILRGLIFQLLRYQPSLYGYILPTFALQKESLFADASFNSLWKIFENMTCDPTLGTIYCVLDGLDECHEESSKALLNKFRRYFRPAVDGASTRKLNLFVACRGYPKVMAELLSRFPRLHLDSQAKDEVNEDVNRFIEAKVNSLAADKCYSEDLRLHIVNVFKERAEGTFLWIGIVAEELRRYNRIEVENVLNLFPPGLETLYGRALLQIEHRQQNITSRILRWVTLAMRPLTLSELGAVLEVQPGKFSTKEEVVKDHVASCGLLLKIQDGDQVGFVHQSAKEYLLRPGLEFFRVKEDPGHCEIAMTCLDYLQNSTLTDGPLTDEDVDESRDSPRIKSNPLLLYAALHWQEHAKTRKVSEAIFDLSIPFYDRDSKVRAAWLETYWRLKRKTPQHLERVATDSSTSDPYEKLPPLVQQGIQYALSRKDALRRKGALRRKDSRLPIEDFYGFWKKKKTVQPAKVGTPLPERHLPVLHLASHFGIIPLANKILSERTQGEPGSNTIDIDGRDGFGWTALYHAAYNGQEDMTMEQTWMQKILRSSLARREELPYMRMQISDGMKWLGYSSSTVLTQLRKTPMD